MKLLKGFYVILLIFLTYIIYNWDYYTLREDVVSLHRQRMEGVILTIDERGIIAFDMQKDDAWKLLFVNNIDPITNKKNAITYEHIWRRYGNVYVMGLIHNKGYESKIYKLSGEKLIELFSVDGDMFYQDFWISPDEQIFIWSSSKTSSGEEQKRVKGYILKNSKNKMAKDVSTDEVISFLSLWGYSDYELCYKYSLTTSHEERAFINMRSMGDKFEVIGTFDGRNIYLFREFSGLIPVNDLYKYDWQNKKLVLANKNNGQWIRPAFSPDGKYVVAEVKMEYRRRGGYSLPDFMSIIDLTNYKVVKRISEKGIMYDGNSDVVWVDKL